MPKFTEKQAKSKLKLVSKELAVAQKTIERLGKKADKLHELKSKLEGQLRSAS
jgi:hypothetical protein